MNEFVDRVAQEDLGLIVDDYVPEQELEAADLDLPSPTQHVATRYTIYPVDVWVAPPQLDALAARVSGQWLTCEEAVNHPQISPPASQSGNSNCRSPGKVIVARQYTLAGSRKDTFDLPFEFRQLRSSFFVFGLQIAPQFRRHVVDNDRIAAAEVGELVHLRIVEYAIEELQLGDALVDVMSDPALFAEYAIWNLPGNAQELRSGEDA